MDTEESNVLEHREYAESLTASRDNIKVQKTEEDILERVQKKLNLPLTKAQEYLAKYGKQKM